jgi:PAS domain S-box-containing protein
VAELSSNVPPYTRDEAVRYIEAAKGGRTVRFEWQRRNKDGTLHWDEVVIQRVELGGERRILAVTREITERKRTEQALRDSESLYRGLFNASADAMVLRDADFRVVDVNPSYTTMSGYSREETIGAGRVLTVEDEDNARWLAAHRGLLAGGQLRFEFSARRKDGSPYEAEVRGMPVSWNERPHVLYVTRDITERKRAERALAASEEQYRGIFNASADALVLWNSELKVVDVNPAYLRIYRQRREDVVGLGYPAHYPKEYVERRQQLIRRALAGETCELQTQSYRPDGELFEVEWRVVPVLHRGEPHALAIARDITERKAAEAALRASEEQYRAVFEASVDGLLLWDAGHRIVDVNRAFLAMHGYRREELIGGTTPAFIPPELREQCAELLPDILGGKPCHIESRSRRRGGEEIEVEIHGVPVLYQGRPHVLIVLRDITERKRAEQALKLREEQYRVIFDGSADALVLWDEDIRIVDVNRAFTAMYGFAREEVIGGTLDSRMSPEAVASRTARMLWARTDRTSSSNCATCRSRTSAGRTCWRSPATSPSAAPRRWRCAPARSSTGRCSRSPPTRFSCSTPMAGLSTSIRLTNACMAGAAPT